MTPLAGRIAALAVGGSVAALTVRQCRKPTWWLGRFVAAGMNRSHGPLTDWGLSHVEVRKDFTVLDVGCGGGATVARLANLTGGKVYGVDYSAASVATARTTNASRIAAGQVEIREASVSSLPFPDRTFDLVTAVETHYYWPNLAEDLREIRRVLKPGGQAMILGEVYRGSWLSPLYATAMALLGGSYLRPEEHRTAFAAAGYEDIRLDVDRRRVWICVVGRNSGQAPR